MNILTELTTTSHSQICVYHEIVHNKTIVESFTARGVRFVDSLAEVPHDALVLFSAHGVSPALRAEAAARGLTTVDATCPLVQRLHRQVRSYAQKGYHIIFIGYAGHDEAVGTLGEAPDQMSLVSTQDDIARLSPPEHVPLVCLMQTTLLASFSRDMLDALRKRFPHLMVPNHCGICRATQEHQDAIRRLPFVPDLVLVVGSRTSSNSQRLLEVAREKGSDALLIDTAEEIPLDRLTGHEHIVITAGASAPESVVQRCVARLIDTFPDAEITPDKPGV